MIEKFSQKEWADDVNSLATKLYLRKSDLARILGESRFYMAHILSGVRKVTDSRKETYCLLVDFLKEVLSRDGTFKKSVYEHGRHAAERRKSYVSKLKYDFSVLLENHFED